MRRLSEEIWVVSGRSLPSFSPNHYVPALAVPYLLGTLANLLVGESYSEFWLGIKRFFIS
jgi:hypothetical protein